MKSKVQSNTLMLPTAFVNENMEKSIMDICTTLAIRPKGQLTSGSRLKWQS